MMQRFQAKYPRLEAIEVAVITSGEHGFVLRNTDVDVIVEARVFLALYEPVSNGGKPTARRGRKPHAVKSAPKSRRLGRPPAEPGPNDETVTARILAALSKKPMCSSDLANQLGGSIGSIYTVLSFMRKDGRIETRYDETDGVKKNYLTTKT